MTVLTNQLLLEVGLLIVAPLIAGPIVAKWVGDRERKRGLTPVWVRGIRILVTVGWVAMVIVGVVVTLGNVSFLSTLTFSAIAGIAVTLALTTTLQNFVSGLILLQQRALRVGDHVQFSGSTGVVVSFGLTTTVIRLTDGSLAFVSNSNLLNGPLVNSTASERLAGEY